MYKLENIKKNYEKQRGGEDIFRKKSFKEEKAFTHIDYSSACADERNFFSFTLFQEDTIIPVGLLSTF